MAPGLGPWLLALALAAGPAGERRAGRAASPGLRKEAEAEAEARAALGPRLGPDGRQQARLSPGEGRRALARARGLAGTEAGGGWRCAGPGGFAGAAGERPRAVGAPCPAACALRPQGCGRS